MLPRLSPFLAAAFLALVSASGYAGAAAPTAPGDDRLADIRAGARERPPAGASRASAPRGALPYGYAPRSLTWREPPTFLARLRPGAVASLPRGVTEVDVWIAARRYRATYWTPTAGYRETTGWTRPYRLRQRPDRESHGWRFTRARSRRVVAGMNPRPDHDVYNYSRRTLYVYGWKP